MEDDGEDLYVDVDHLEVGELEAGNNHGDSYRSSWDDMDDFWWTWKRMR